MARAGDDFDEPGGSWRPFWLVAGVLGLVVVLDLVLPGPDLSPLLWVLAVVAVLGVVAAGVVSARRAWTVRVDAGTAGVDAGAPVLGGGWSLPRGRSGLPLRTTDGRTVLVPTRDPAALSRALLAAVSDVPGSAPGRKGTLGS